MSRPITPVSQAQPYSESLSHHVRDETPRPATHLGNTDHISIAAGPELDHIDAAQDETSVYSHALEDPEQGAPSVQRSASQAGRSMTPSRHNTLQKRKSLVRSNSKRSSHAGSVRSLKLGEKEKYEETEESNSVFTSPIPVTGNPTELLADRFQGQGHPKRFGFRSMLICFYSLAKSPQGPYKLLPRDTQRI